MALNIQIDQQKIAEFCAKWGIQELGIFNSPFRVNVEEDVADLMYTETGERRYSLFDLVGMEFELEPLFGRRVALTARDTIEQEYSSRLRTAIFSSLKVLYAR